MKTVQINLYSFNELSNEAKETAINAVRNRNDNNQFYFDEIIESVKKLADVFNLKFGREYTDIRTSHIDDNILQLQGLRLHKYIVNNYYNELFKAKYLKSGGVIDTKKPFHRMMKQRLIEANCPNKGKYSISYYSNTAKDNSCVLTGVCYDNDILQPVYDFLARPDKTETFESLINSIESAIQKCFDNTETWLNSDEFTIDEIEANDYEFTIDGNIF